MQQIEANTLMKRQKQILANNLFKISCNYTEGMLSIWKICFNVLNIRKYNELVCNLSKINETV